MSSGTDNVRQYVSVILSLVEKYAYLEKQIPTRRKNECRWEIGAALFPGICGDRKSDTAFIEAVSKQLNAECQRGFGPSVIKDCISVYQAFPQKEELSFGLKWSCYRALIKEPDYDRRLRLLNKAIDRGWSADSLASRITGVRQGYGLHFESCDAFIIDLAQSYTCACGIISVDELGSIYRELSNNPVDDYDFQETLLYMDETSSYKDGPCLWRSGSQTYAIDRSLAGPTDEDKKDIYYDECYGWNNTYVRPKSFLGALRSSYASYVRQKRSELVASHLETPIRRLEGPTSDSKTLSSLLGWRDVEHLREYCTGDIGNSCGYRESYEADFNRAIEQLARHVSQNGIPSDDEILEDSRFLLARTYFSRDQWNRHENRADGYVSGVLKSIYWQLPLWEENGHSAQEPSEPD